MKQFTVDEATNLICGVWGHVPEEQRNIIKENISVKTLKKGAFIYNETEHPQNLAFLIRGKAKIQKEGVSNRNQIVRMIKPNGMFGFRAFFANQEYETAAVAFEESTVAFIPLNIVKELIMTNPDIAFFFVRDLCVKLGKADSRTINLTQKHIRGRLAEALLFLKDNYGVEKDGCTLCVHVSREEMANMSNMITSNAIRTLSSFADEKLVELDGRRIKILDEIGLKLVSERG